MSDQDPTTATPGDPLLRLVQSLVDHLAEDRSARDRFEQRAIPLLERIALALERGSVLAAGSEPDPAFMTEVRAAIDERRWDRAQAILDGLASQEPPDPRAEALAIELAKARERAIGALTDRIAGARLANDAEGALLARDELAHILQGDDLKEVDRPLIAWLMKLIQRRLRSIPIGPELANLASDVANRFGGTTEGASLRAALPTLRRSAGLCPRCAEPYLGVDQACDKCMAEAGQTPAPAPTLTFVTDDLDAVVGEAKPVDLNNAEIWQLP